MHFDGPHFDANLFGPTGKLTRLHKGGAPKPAPPPPPVRQSDRAVSEAGSTAQRKNRGQAGYASTMNTGSLLAPTSASGQKTLLG